MNWGMGFGPTGKRILYVCPECGVSWDEDQDTAEWTDGHDCEVTP